MFESLHKSLTLAVRSITDQELEILLEKPKSPEHGDVSCPVAMRLSKILKQNPFEIAGLITQKLDLPPEILECHVVKPGFLNFRFHDWYLLDNLKCSPEKLNKSFQKNYGKKVSLEHTAINPNKQPHVGHLRNACIGHSIQQVLKFLNYDVLTLYYHNDIGMQISCLVLALEVYSDKVEDYPSTSKWASSVYERITKDLADDQTLKNRQEEIHKAMMDPYSKESDQAYKITFDVLKNILEVMQKFQIDYDLVVCESSIIDHHLWDETFQILQEKPGFYKVESGERQGCYVIDMPADQEAKVIVRSNGVPTYAGNDITNHLWKFGLINDFKYKLVDFKTQSKPLHVTSHTGTAQAGFNQAESIVNVIDTTQTYPQESVKQAFATLGYQEIAKNYHHINYGFVHLSSNTAKSLGIDIDPSLKQVKISGRKGTVVTVEHLLDLMQQKLREQFGDFEALELLAVGAITYEMLKIDTYRDVVFDIDRALDIKGNSGTYLLYTYARSQGILRKVDTLGVFDKKIELEPKERGLALKITELNDVITKTHDSLSPHLLCNYLYELCQTYNSFYNDCHVLNHKRSSTRIKLVEEFAQSLKLGLSLLGMAVAEEI